jgi:3-oxoadipate enol-lactonase
VNLYHRLDGDPDAPAMVLSGSIGSTLELWDAQVPALARRFRVIRYDHPGHGRSPLDGSTIAEFARHAVALLDDLGVERVSWCGLSLGGAVGMRVALDAPDRVDRLALLCTSARFDDPEEWRDRARRVRASGLEPIADSSLGRWFTPAFADVPRYRAMLVSTDAEGYARACDAIHDWDVRDELGAIRAPTLAIAGADDPSTPPRHLEEIARSVPGARLEVLPGARHLLNVERADEVNRLLLEHLA